MTVEDLVHIFEPQIAEGTTKLYFMLVDGERKFIERHPAHGMNELLPMLDSFQYAGTVQRMPRFVK